MWSKQLSDRLQGKHTASSLMIYGGARDGFAKELAKAYLCEGDPTPCGRCAHCLKVEKGIHPDLVWLGEEGESMKVSAVRELRSDAHIRPNEAQRKIYIITHAQTLNQSGQNALLKLLEEGPSYAVFFFLLPNPEQLLVTLRSRSELIYCYEEAAYEISQTAKDIVDCIKQDTDPFAIMPLLVALEKKKRDDFVIILDDLIAELSQRVKETPALYLPKLDAVQTLRRDAEFNIGVGHMVGFLMAKLV